MSGHGIHLNRPRPVMPAYHNITQKRNRKKFEHNRPGLTLEMKTQNLIY